MQVRLGRLPHDPEKVAVLPKQKFGLIAPPPILNRSHVDFVPGMYENNILPDCTAVGYVNGARALAALNGFNIAVDANAARDFYGAVVGNPPDLAATDGALVTDVLAHQDAHGVPIGPQSLVARYGVVDSTSRIALANSLVRLGTGYWGVTLRERDMQTLGGALPWDTVPGRDDGQIVGGHLLLGWDYAGLSDLQTVRLATWGAFQAATWRWIAARLDEAYALVWRQLAKTDGTFFNGLTADGLMGQL